jgi:hypothetical protein
MSRFWGLCCFVGLAAAIVGCGTVRYTAGVCDCAPPPVESLLVPPQLPPHLCTTPQAAACPTPARMQPAGN